MLDARITDLAQRTIDVALKERWAPLTRQTLDITSEFTRRGSFGGSRMYLQIVGLYKAELDIQASMAWGHLQRVIASVGVGSVGSIESLANNLKVFMTTIIEGIAASLLDHLNDTTVFKKRTSGVGIPKAPLEQAKAHAVNKIGCEIDIYVARLELTARQAQVSGGTNVTITGGQVGIVQTGNFATASMVVTLDDTSKREIVAALNAVEAAVREARETPFNKDEVLREVEECKTEANKPSPNVTRIKGALLGLATSVQTVAALKPAYDALKGALALVGVTLP